MQTEQRWAFNSDSVMSDQRSYMPGELQPAASIDPTRVLIVADLSASVRIAALVHFIGRFETRIVSSTDSALSVARYFLPNIALMSTDFPDLAGYHLASALRWRSGLPSLRLIALTDDILSTDRRRALAAGFEQYLTLPVQQAALESALAPRLENRPRGRDLRAALRPQN